MSDIDPHLVERAKARVGATLKGKYKLAKLLAVGGMASVYLGVHRNGNRVAIKMLHPDLALSRDARRRFIQEGYAANNVHHPGVVRALDDDQLDDGSVFVVMELLSGNDIEPLRDGPMPLEQTLELGYRLLDVLACAHERGIVHRDVKPGNLFLTDDGDLKVLDFGLARMRTAGPGTTESGRVYGTPAFMPPEQALGKMESVDARSDVYSAGATLFTMLTGKYVHPATTAAEQLVFAAARPARSLSELMPDAPIEVIALVDRALSHDRANRWQTARDMQTALEKAYEVACGRPIGIERHVPNEAPADPSISSSPSQLQSAVSKTLTSGDPARPPDDERKRRVVRSLWVATGVSAVVAVAAALVLLFSSKESPPAGVAPAPSAPAQAPPAPAAPEPSTQPAANDPADAAAASDAAPPQETKKKPRWSGSGFRRNARKQVKSRAFDRQ